MNQLEKWPVSSAKASVLIVHGAGEHIGRYQWVISRLNEQGYTVYGGDLPGFGRSPGKKGHVDQFDVYTDQVNHWWQQMTEADSGPFYVLGHSMGGLITVAWLEKCRDELTEPAGVILSSPALGTRVKVPFWKEALSKTLNRLVPGLRMDAGIKPEYVSRDVKVSDAYRDDPLVVKRLSVRWYREFLHTIEQVWLKRDQFPDVPLLVLQAEKDRLVDPEMSRTWVEALHIKDKQFHMMKAMYHEVLQDPDKEKVMNIILSWIEHKS
ncbi:MAG: alpha/beta hydrolase [Bacillaceae bacterium]|nr:alpha/beta hydrolase [Bacillaceae bacterium]